MTDHATIEPATVEEMEMKKQVTKTLMEQGILGKIKVGGLYIELNDTDNICRLNCVRPSSK